MNKIYYKKASHSRLNKKKFVARTLGFTLLTFGMSLVIYIFAPLLLWQIFIAPVMASQQIASPIPNSKFISAGTISNLVSSELSQFNTDYNDAKNWFPNVPENTENQTKSGWYTISIPAINITNAIVSTTDTDLAHHLVQFPNTAVPTQIGNTVIIGHSTLPSLYDPKNYKTIFAYAHTLKIGDKILVNIGNITYTYKIFSMTIVNPDDTSIFTQPTDDSYFTIVTCTPPGTIWKRLIISSRLQKL